MGKNNQRNGEQEESAGLYQQKPSVPSPYTQPSRVDFTERQEKHAKDQGGLYDTYRFSDKDVSMIQKVKGGVDEIRQDARSHSDGQHPGLQKFFYVMLHGI